MSVPTGPMRSRSGVKMSPLTGGTVSDSLTV